MTSEFAALKSMMSQTLTTVVGIANEEVSFPNYVLVLPVESKGGMMNPMSWATQKVSQSNAKNERYGRRCHCCPTDQ